MQWKYFWPQNCRLYQPSPKQPQQPLQGTKHSRTFTVYIHTHTRTNMHMHMYAQAKEEEAPQSLQVAGPPLSACCVSSPQLSATPVGGLAITLSILQIKRQKVMPCSKSSCSGVVDPMLQPTSVGPQTQAVPVVLHGHLLGLRSRLARTQIITVEQPGHSHMREYCTAMKKIYCDVQPPG